MKAFQSIYKISEQGLEYLRPPEKEDFGKPGVYWWNKAQEQGQLDQLALVELPVTEEAPDAIILVEKALQVAAKAIEEMGGYISETVASWDLDAPELASWHEVKNRVLLYEFEQFEPHAQTEYRQAALQQLAIKARLEGFSKFTGTALEALETGVMQGDLSWKALAYFAGQVWANRQPDSRRPAIPIEPVFIGDKEGPQDLGHFQICRITSYQSQWGPSNWVVAAQEDRGVSFHQSTALVDKYGICPGDHVILRGTKSTIENIGNARLQKLNRVKVVKVCKN